MASGSGNLLQAVPDALKLSREYALLGKYDTAAVYFDGAVAAIQQYVAPDSCLRLAQVPNDRLVFQHERLLMAHHSPLFIINMWHRRAQTSVRHRPSDRYLRAVTDPVLRAKVQRLKECIGKEVKMVKDLSVELGAFKVLLASLHCRDAARKVAVTQRAGLQEEPGQRPVACGAPRSRYDDKPPPQDDPAVWEGGHALRVHNV